MSVFLRLACGATREMPLAEVTSTLVLSAVPWRTIRSHRGQQHLPGLYWSSTTGWHVVYESRLELARLLLADMDREVVGIAAQPFLLRDGGRRHVPDFLLSRADGSVLVVNVKPRDRLKNARVADALGWAEGVFVGRGWEHEVWSGADPQLLANVRFLAGYRRDALLEPRDLTIAASLRGADLTVADAEAALMRGGVREPGPVVLHLLWSGALRAELDRPLTGETGLPRLPDARDDARFVLPAVRRHAARSGHTRRSRRQADDPLLPPSGRRARTPRPTLPARPDHGRIGCARAGR